MRWLALVLGLTAFPAGAETCRLALALAIDVSRSVNDEDYLLQTDGLIAALEDAAVRRAFFDASGEVALAIYYWSGTGHQQPVLDWTRILAPADLDGVAAALRAAERPPQRMATALGAALQHGHDLLQRAPDCRRRVLDMAGDGRNNEGPGPGQIFADADFAGITVNALAIGEHESGLRAYFEAEIRRGPGSFVEIADRQSDFPIAMRRKLLRELAETFAGTPAACGCLPMRPGSSSSQ